MTDQAPMQSAYPHMNGRDKLPWSADVWKRLDTAVHEEMNRARVPAKFMPTVHVPAKTLTVPSDTVTNGPSVAGTGNALSVDEGATTRINEYWVEFTLTPAQVEHEAREQADAAHASSTSTGVTLATRAANRLAQAEDMLIFQGSNALQSPLFKNNPVVNNRGTPADLGLANIQLASITPPGGIALPNTFQVISVSPVSGAVGVLPNVPAYAGNTVGGVAMAYAILNALGQYGPYALVLEAVPYADAHTPLPSTLILPADPIKEFATSGFYGTSALPPWFGGAFGGSTQPSDLGLPPPPTTQSGGGSSSSSSSSSGQNVLFIGLLVSIGGNTMDVVRGTLHPEHDVCVTFEQKDVNGNYRFRVVERFALRLKDLTAVTLLEFMSG